MRILVADAFPDASITELAKQHNVRYRPDLSADGLCSELPGVEVLIVRSTEVREASIGAADTLRLVIRAGSGTNTIDRAAASQRGIYVCNVPGRNATAVAELAMGLLLCLDRDIPDNVADLRALRWEKRRYARARGIAGRRVGIVGLGQIGLAFAELAAAFGTHVHAIAKPGRDDDTLRRASVAGITMVESLETLAGICDVLSLHLPADPANHHLVDRELLAAMRPGAFLLNTARAELIDETALIEAMEEKGIRAGLDVFADEPGAASARIDSALARHPNVYGTHHIGASTEQAQEAIATEVLRMITEFEGGRVPHCVNLEDVRQANLITPARSGGP